MDVLISGASIAGPALAYWLGRYGFRPTIVEIAPALRTGGNAVDFRGPLHLGVLSRMGVLDALREVQTGGTAMRFVDDDGARLMEWPAGLAGGDLEVLRGDLARILCEAGGDRTEYLFGDSIAAMRETPVGVEVTFASGLERTFDLVIGADGVHSGVRRLTFDPAESVVKHLGYYVSGWAVPNEWGLTRDMLLHSAPGRMAGVGGDHRDPSRASAFFAFASPRLAYDRHDPAAPREILRSRFAGMGWLTPRLLSFLDTAPDLYFDQICRVDNPSWTRGRIALVGDAACGATIGGQGNGTAIVSAYVLAGELAAAGGDHRTGFTAYENRMRPYTASWQRGANPGKFLAPASTLGLRFRNTLFGTRLVQKLLISSTKSLATDADLPEYTSS